MHVNQISCVPRNDESGVEAGLCLEKREALEFEPRSSGIRVGKWLCCFVEERFGGTSTLPARQRGLAFRLQERLSPGARRWSWRPWPWRPWPGWTGHFALPGGLPHVICSSSGAGWRALR